MVKKHSDEKRIMIARHSKLSLFFVLGYLWWRKKYIEVTNKRVIYRSGLISKTEKMVALDHVLDVTVRQGLSGRIFGYGNIAIQTAGTSGAEFVFKNIAGPTRLRDAIMTAQDALKKGEAQRERELLQMQAQEAALHAHQMLGAQSGEVRRQAPRDDPVAALEKLKTMLDKGLISAEEYNRKKTQLLSRM